MFFFFLSKEIKAFFFRVTQNQRVYFNKNRYLVGFLNNFLGISFKIPFISRVNSTCHFTEFRVYSTRAIF